MRLMEKSIMAAKCAKIVLRFLTKFFQNDIYDEEESDHQRLETDCRS